MKTTTAHTMRFFAVFAVAAVLCLAPRASCCSASDSDTIAKVQGTCKATQSAPDYRYYCMPNLKATCGSTDNKACRHCILLYEAVNANGWCATAPNKYCAVRGDTTLQISTAESGKVAHWKLVPKQAIRGVEDLQSSGSVSSLDKLWQDGWQAVKSPTAGWKLPFDGSVPSFKAAFAINSPYTRTDHQMHIHIAKLNPSFIGSLGIKAPSKFGRDWISLNNGRALMMCPKAGSPPTPFADMKAAVGAKKWVPADVWYHTTLALIQPQFCSGGATCDFCQLLLYNVGDQQVLSY